VLEILIFWYCLSSGRNRYQQIERKIWLRLRLKRKPLRSWIRGWSSELRLNKVGKCHIILLFGIATNIWMDAPNNPLIGRLRRILLLPIVPGSYPTLPLNSKFPMTSFSYRTVLLLELWSCNPLPDFLKRHISVVSVHF
jgi:hypothetical protein